MHPTTFILLLLLPCLLEQQVFCDKAEEFLTTKLSSSVPPSHNLFIAVFDDDASLQQHKNIFQSLVHQENIGLKERFTFSEFFKGISFELSSMKELAKIANLTNVKEIFSISNLAGPTLITKDIKNNPLQYTHSMTGVAEIRKYYGYKGKGVKVGIIDTGIDYTHPDLGGCFGPGCKVAYGYNLVHEIDGSSPYDPMDSCSGHGTHVAGIIAANGENFTGVAPEATLGAYKIFPCLTKDRVTEDTIIAAIEKAYQDKMDIINISFGLPSGWQKQPVSIAVDKLTEKGIHVFASSGNLGMDGLWLINSPAIASKASAIASFDSVRYLANVFKLVGKADTFDYFTKDSIPLTLNNTELVSTLHRGNNFFCSSLKNSTWITRKIVLIQRGGCDFSEKIFNLKNAGALAVGFYNNEFGPLYAAIDDMNDVPVFSLTNATVKHLISLLKKEKVFITFLPQPQPFDTPYGGKISAFSSWGPGPLLEQKPDFGAPGGLVYSTFPVAKGGYATLSGTSMATPYVSATAAILLEARGKLLPLELRELLRQTSIPAKQYGTNSSFSPVQQQGAGMINLFRALTSTAYVTPAKIQLLSEDLEESYNRIITVKNTGNRLSEYVVSHSPALSVKPWDKTTGELSKRPTISSTSANVQVSTKAFKLAPGHTKNITVIFSKKDDVNVDEKLLFGGYISITPSSIEKKKGGFVPVPVQVTYTGMFGTYKDIPILLDIGMLKGESFSLQEGDFPTLEATFRHPAKKMQIKILNRMNKVLGLIENTAFSHLGRHDYTKYLTSTFLWKGDFVSVDGKLTQAKNGIYKLKLELLPPFGDEGLASDWQSWTSPQFTVNRSHSNIHKKRD